MTKRPKRPRAAQRENDRELEKLRRVAIRVYEAELGGAPDRPLEIASAAQVEPDAESRTCPLCGESMRAEGHDVIDHQGSRLRVARLVCKTCHARFDRYYRLGPVLS